MDYFRSTIDLLCCNRLFYCDHGHVSTITFHTHDAHSITVAIRNRCLNLLSLSFKLVIFMLHCLMITEYSILSHFFLYSDLMVKAVVN